MKNNLREKRKIFNFRLIDLAIKSGIGISTIWLIEQGYERRTSRETKKKIAQALDSTIEEIFGE